MAKTPRDGSQVPSCQSPTWMAGTQALRPSDIAFTGALAGAGSEVENLGLESLLVLYINITGLTHCAQCWSF